MLISYHNHTTWSDGAADLAGQIEAGARLQLDELGISDHLVLHPRGETVEWSMPPGRLPDYVAEVRGAAGLPGTPVIRLGVEADYFPETVEALRESLRPHPFDYVIGSVHSLGEFPIDESPQHWDVLTPDEVDVRWRDYWRMIAALAASGVYDFVGHLDLPKKFGHRPSNPTMPEALEALDAIREADMAIEINTAGWSLPAAEAYPSPGLLHEARARGIPLLINSDAHFPEFLIRDFDRARRLAWDAGYRQLVRYDRRERIPYDLDDR